MRNYSADQFELLEELGKGSFGVVYKALDKVTNNIVAVKQIDLESSDEDINEIQKEITILSTCKFPQIIKYYGCYVNKYQLSIIMEVLQGGSCLDLLHSIQHFEEYQIAIICREILKALSYLHSNNKIHRDIKAANILIDDHNGDVKVVDFGVATQLSNNLSKRNTFVGTPFWMSPEVILQHDYNYQTDIWSLGITALELALGKPPYSNLHPLKVLFLIPKNPAPVLPLLSPFNRKPYSKEFQSFIKLCLQKNSSLRPSAKQLLNHPFIVNAGKNIELLQCVDLKRKLDLKKILLRKDDTHSNSSQQNNLDKKKVAASSRRISLSNSKSRVISFDFDNSKMTENETTSEKHKIQNIHKNILTFKNSNENNLQVPVSPRRKLGDYYNYNSDDDGNDIQHENFEEMNKENQIQPLQSSKHLKVMQKQNQNIPKSRSHHMIGAQTYINEASSCSIKHVRRFSRNQINRFETEKMGSDTRSISGTSSKSVRSASNILLSETKTPHLSPRESLSTRTTGDSTPLSISPVKFDSAVSSVFTPLSSASSSGSSSAQSRFKNNTGRKIEHNNIQSETPSMRKSGRSSLTRSQTTGNLGRLSRSQSSVVSSFSRSTSPSKIADGSKASARTSHRRGNSEICSKDKEKLKGHQRGKSEIVRSPEIRQHDSGIGNHDGIRNLRNAYASNHIKESNDEYLGKSVFEFELRESKLQKYKKGGNNLFEKGELLKEHQKDLQETDYTKRDSIEELLLSRWAESMVERWSMPTSII